MSTALRSRRLRRVASLLVALAACASPGHRRVLGVPVPFGAARELPVEQQARQAINRLTFGARPGDVERVLHEGVDRWIAAQLAPERLTDAAWDTLAPHFATQHDAPHALVRALVDSYPPIDVYIRAVKRAHGLPDTARILLAGDDSATYERLFATGTRRANDVLAAKVARAEVSERQLLEVMTDFWENHFSVYAPKSPTRFTMVEYDRDVIRPHALGRFRDLLGAVAHSSAMLYYLDNVQSRVDSGHVALAEWRAAQQAHRAPRPSRRRAGLNENYARELMELHTLGVDGGYTQHDVIEVARALTGWTLDSARAGGAFAFHPEAHDADAKTVLGHALPAGRGVEDGEEVLDVLAQHPSTAHFIAYKLARRFVADTPSTALVARAAATFTKTGGDIRETLRTILTSPEFFSQRAYRTKVKSPFELVVSARRALASAPDTTAATAQLVARLGQPLFGHLTPEGWPETGDAWMNAGAILNRINAGAAVAVGRLPGASVAHWPASTALAAAPRAAQVDGVVAAVLEGEAGPDTRAILLGGRNPLAPASAVPNTARGAALRALAELVGLALGAPEFQRR